MAKLGDHARARARDLRMTATDAEQRLWSLLRDRRLGGWKFRRQHPIPPWTADHACPDARLVVEADGGQHASGADEERDRDLAARGWRVLRFWNHDILREPETVAATILAALGEEGGPPSPRPSPILRAGEGANVAARGFPRAPSPARSTREGEPSIAVVVHDLAQARAALKAAPGAVLVSAPGAAAFAGVGFLKAVEDGAGARLVVDCGDDAGLVMAGLRAGLRDLLFAGDERLLAPLAEMAEAVGGRVRDRLDLPTLLLEPGEDPGRGRVSA